MSGQHPQGVDVDSLRGAVQRLGVHQAGRFPSCIKITFHLLFGTIGNSNTMLKMMVVQFVHQITYHCPEQILSSIFVTVSDRQSRNSNKQIKILHLKLIIISTKASYYIAQYLLSQQVSLSSEGHHGGDD